MSKSQKITSGNFDTETVGKLEKTKRFLTHITQWAVKLHFVVAKYWPCKISFAVRSHISYFIYITDQCYLESKIKIRKIPINYYVPTTYLKSYFLKLCNDADQLYVPNCVSKTRALTSPNHLRSVSVWSSSKASQINSIQAEPYLLAWISCSECVPQNCAWNRANTTSTDEFRRLLKTCCRNRESNTRISGAVTTELTTP